MNKRIKKKRRKQYHKQFCHESFEYQHGYSKRKYAADQCPKCGWDSDQADTEYQMARILWRRGGFFDMQFEAEYTCPVCNTVFSFIDGV